MNRCKHYYTGDREFGDGCPYCEIARLGEIESAARAFVDAFDADAVQDFLREVCASEWKELNEVLGHNPWKPGDSQ